MSIKVENLTKVYGDQKAVEDISFSIDKGEIVGFLGPNGAGKSTTMKMLTTYIKPSSGDAFINGHSILEEDRALRRDVGYLPEQNPLYLDAYIREYLAFVAQLHKIKFPKERIEEVIELTGLKREVHKKIGQLSKGYRQRVGLAQAIIHDPSVLILDEPTAGLDPNQLVEIRSLIQSLGADKTVLFSSHIMQEVQAICDRVVIINQGKITADQPIAQITQSKGSTNQVIKCLFEEKSASKRLQAYDRCKEISQKQGYIFATIEGKGDARKAIYEFAKAEDLTLLHLELAGTTLEEAFQAYTKNKVS